MTSQCILAQSKGIDELDKKGVTMLWSASINGEFETVNDLLSKGADSNLRVENGTTPLIAACQNGYFEVVKLLVSNGADVNKTAIENAGLWSPLIMTANNGHTEITSLLIEEGAQVNYTGTFQATPIAYAAYKGHL